MNNDALLNRLAGVLMKHVEPIFEADALVTLIVRFPGNDEADVLVTADSIGGIEALIERCKSRDEVKGADHA